MQKYLNKFSSRYSGNITIKGDRPLNYKLNAELNGYLDVSKDNNKIKRRIFIVLEGGLLTGKGFLNINKIP